MSFIKDCRPPRAGLLLNSVVKGEGTGTFFVIFPYFILFYKLFCLLL